ncbi:MAG: beta-ketoacyl-ACP synthase III [Bdellovibrionales bacterium]
MNFPYSTRVAGTGSYLPNNKLTNADIIKRVDTTEDWILDRTGIKTRNVASPEETTTDLAYNASLKALEAASLQAENIDFIIFATVSGDQVMPSSACLLQAKLGVKNIGAIDISAACTGFIYALSMADQYIKTGMYKNILVVGAEVLTRYVNYKDRDTCILFGDGAGAFICQRDESQESKIYSSHLHASGELGDLFELPGGGSKHPFSQDMLDNDLQYMRMKGREVFKNAVRAMNDCCREALEENNFTEKDIQWLIPHQANIRIIETVAKYFEISHEKVVINIDRTGNTSAATIPIAFDEAVRDGRICRSHNVMLAAFGAGITSGSLLLKF